MSKPLFKSLTKPLFSSLTASVKQAINSRYVTTLNPAGGMYYSFEPLEIPADIEFEMEVEVAYTGGELGYYPVFDTSPNNTVPRFTLQRNTYIDNGQSWEHGSFQLRVNNDIGNPRYLTTDIENRNPDFPRKVNTITIKRENDVFFMKTNEGSFSSLIHASNGWDTYTLEGLANYSGFSFFNLKVWLNGNRSTGKLVRDYRFDDSDGVLINYATELGANLWDNQRFVDANGADSLVEVTQGSEYDLQLLSASPNNVATGMRVLSFKGLSIGNTYIYKVKSTRPVNIAAYDGSYRLISLAKSSESLTFFASEITRLYVCPIDSEVVTITSPSVQKADGYGKALNVTAADRELMTFDVARNAWIGEATGKVIEVAQ
ncbi:hypothetical protein B1199_03005 [Pseudoalteromonas ulvae]|uniref:Uncharacterized protein n=2 Tax=Pseudoalteromonas ulvae TaxID=107327 RepID=A0A244CUF5_PSEDV|nr:hypothetical protein B1199_03005 [Pseudoalteromonas ulvae]